MPNCAHCTVRSCNNGTTEKAPANCPGRFTDKEKELARYSEDDKRTFVAAAEVEAEGYCQKVRVQEIMDYAYKCGYKRLGVAHCIGLRNEARVFADILKANGFEVETVCCKVGGIDKSEMGVDRKSYVSDCEFEAMCNPAGQAAVLDEAGCELNILLGLCVGHDTLFIKNSKAPITVLAAKDRVTGHNPLAAIYNADSYYRRKFENYVEK